MKNLKALTEKRNTLVDEMEALTNKALEETRAMTEEEVRDFDAKKAEVEPKDIQKLLDTDLIMNK